MSKVYTKDEVADHCSEESMWIIIKGKVYDVTDFGSSKQKQN